MMKRYQIKENRENKKMLHNENYSKVTAAIDELLTQKKILLLLLMGTVELGKQH